MARVESVGDALPAGLIMTITAEAGVLSEVSVSPPTAEPVGLTGELLVGVGAVVRERTTARFAALYPAAMQTVAVNDGAHVSTVADAALHAALSALLASRRCWLLFDAQTLQGRLVTVGAAQSILCS